MTSISDKWIAFLESRLEMQHGCYLFLQNDPIGTVDIDGRVAPVVVVGGVTIGAAEAAAASFGVGVVACMGMPDCRAAAMALMKEAADEAAEALRCVGVHAKCLAECSLCVFGKGPAGNEWDFARCVNDCLDDHDCLGVARGN